MNSLTYWRCGRHSNGWWFRNLEYHIVNWIFDSLLKEFKSFKFFKIYYNNIFEAHFLFSSSSFLTLNSFSDIFTDLNMVVSIFLFLILVFLQFFLFWLLSSLQLHRSSRIALCFHFRHFVFLKCLFGSHYFSFDFTSGISRLCIFVVNYFYFKRFSYLAFYS